MQEKFYPVVQAIFATELSTRFLIWKLMSNFCFVLVMRITVEGPEPCRMDLDNSNCSMGEGQSRIFFLRGFLELGEIPGGGGGGGGGHTPSVMISWQVTPFVTVKTLTCHESLVHCTLELSKWVTSGVKFYSLLGGGGGNSSMVNFGFRAI